jgi:hypothetical protein
MSTSATSSTEASNNLDTVTLAEILVSYGWVAIPLRDKIPVTKGWQNTTLEKSVSLVTQTGRRANNVGIVCGRSSGIVVVDIDREDDGLAYWEELLQEQRDRGLSEEEILPVTFSVRTPSGGQHIYFQYNARTSGLRNGKRMFSGRGIDFKTTGGQVVAPGSADRATGVLYRVIGTRAYVPDETNPTGRVPVVAEMPDWLLRKLQLSQL